MRSRAAWLALYIAGVFPALAADAPYDYVPHAQKVGFGRLSFLLWDVYDATLYAPYGKWSADAPYALTLHYFHAIKGVDIADRSIEEMRKQGFADDAKLALWHTQMRTIFPNVTNGTELTAVRTIEKETIFYEGGRRIGSVEDAVFSKQFFNIWLGDKTSEPALRKKLLRLS